MEDNKKEPKMSLQDKINLSNEAKVNDHSKRNKLLIIIGAILLLIVIVFGILYFVKSSKPSERQVEKQVKIVDNKSDDNPYNQFSSGRVKDRRNPILLEKFKLKSGNYGDPKEALNLSDEYKQALNEYYNSEYHMNDQIETVLPSKNSEGVEYTSDPQKKKLGQDGNPLYMAVTSKELETIINHKIETIVNPKYLGKDGEDIYIKSVVVESTFENSQSPNYDKERFDQIVDNTDTNDIKTYYTVRILGDNGVQVKEIVKVLQVNPDGSYIWIEEP